MQDNLTLAEKLTELNRVLPFNAELTFKFSADPDHDRMLIDWFCENGEIRAYRFHSGVRSRFNINLITKNGLSIHIGNAYDGMKERDGHPAQWQNDYIRHAWNKKKEVVYCTNNLLRTPAEVTQQFHGDVSYAFSNSSENENSMVRNSERLISILNTI